MKQINLKKTRRKSLANKLISAGIGMTIAVASAGFLSSCGKGEIFDTARRPKPDRVAGIESIAVSPVNPQKGQKPVLLTGQRVKVEGQFRKHWNAKSAWVDPDTGENSGHFNLGLTDPGILNYGTDAEKEQVKTAENNPDYVLIGNNNVVVDGHGNFSVVMDAYDEAGPKNLRVELVNAVNLEKTHVDFPFIVGENIVNPIYGDDDDDNDDVVDPLIECNTYLDCVPTPCAAIYQPSCTDDGDLIGYGGDETLFPVAVSELIHHFCEDNQCVEINPEACELSQVVYEDSVACDGTICLTNDDCAESNCDDMVPVLEPCEGTWVVDDNNNGSRDYVVVDNVLEGSCDYGRCNMDVVECVPDFADAPLVVEIGSCGAQCTEDDLSQWETYLDEVTNPNDYTISCIGNVFSRVPNTCETDAECDDGNAFTSPDTCGADGECSNPQNDYDCEANDQCADNVSSFYFADSCTGDNGDFNYTIDLNDNGTFDGVSLPGSCENACTLYPIGATDAEAGFCEDDCFPEAPTAPTTLEECLIGSCNADCDEDSLDVTTDCESECVGSDYVTRADVVNTCVDCMYTTDVCEDTNISVNDILCGECVDDSGCASSDSISCEGDNLVDVQGVCDATYSCTTTSTTENCSDLSGYSCMGTELFEITGYCNDSTTTTDSCQTLEESLVECDDGLSGNGLEGCDADAGVCTPGVAPDCSGNDWAAIDACDYDSNTGTRDIFAGYTSSWDELMDECTTAPIDVTSTCDVVGCGAECDENSQDEIVGCVSGCEGLDYVTRADVVNTCGLDCAYENNVCEVTSVSPNDPLCENPCDTGADCEDVVTWAEFPEDCTDYSYFDIDNNESRSFPAWVSTVTENVCDAGYCTNPAGVTPTVDMNDVEEREQVGECGVGCLENDACETSYCVSDPYQEECDSNGTLWEYNINGVMDSETVYASVENNCLGYQCEENEADCSAPTQMPFPNHPACAEFNYNDAVSATTDAINDFPLSTTGDTLYNSTMDVGYGTWGVDQLLSFEIGNGWEPFELGINYSGYPGEDTATTPNFDSGDIANINSFYGLGFFVGTSVVGPTYSSAETFQENYDRLYDCVTDQLAYGAGLGTPDNRDVDCE
jgi:hypothetical protein